MTTGHRPAFGEVKMKRLISLVFIIFAYCTIVSSQEAKLPDIIETPVGNFIKDGRSYSCELEKDGHRISLVASAEENISQQQLDQRLLILQEKFLHLSEFEKKVFSYAAKKAADGKYKKLIAKSTKHIVSIMIDDSDKLEFWLVTEESIIHGCDFIVVYCELDGSFETVALVG